MNKKILFTTALSFVALGCISAIGGKTVQSNAADTFEENRKGLLYVNKIEKYRFKNGNKVLGSVETFTNNAAGYKTEVLYDLYNENTQSMTKDTQFIYEYNEKNQILKCTEKYFHEVKEIYCDSTVELYEYNNDGKLIKHTVNNVIMGPDNIVKMSEEEYTYADNGLVETYKTYNVGSKEQKYVYTYDEKNNVTSQKRYVKNGGVDVLSSEDKYTYDKTTNDCTKKEYTSYDPNTGLIFTSNDVLYTYSEPHKCSLEETVTYEENDQERSLITFYEKYEYTYNGNEVTRIYSSREEDAQTWNIFDKHISYETKELEYYMDFTYVGNDQWAFELGEKYEYIYSNGKYLGYKGYNSAEEPNVWQQKSEEIITYVSNPAVTNISIGAIIGIVVGVIAVVYFAGFALWKKSVSFLTKPVFGKVYGWLDRIFKKK